MWFYKHFSKYGQLVATIISIFPAPTLLIAHIWRLLLSRFPWCHHHSLQTHPQLNTSCLTHKIHWTINWAQQWTPPQYHWRGIKSMCPFQHGQHFQPQDHPSQLQTPAKKTSVWGKTTLCTSAGLSCCGDGTRDNNFILRCLLSEHSMILRSLFSSVIECLLSYVYEGFTGNDKAMSNTFA